MSCLEDAIKNYQRQRKLYLRRFNPPTHLFKDNVQKIYHKLNYSGVRYSTYQKPKPTPLQQKCKIVSNITLLHK